ncbi:MAG: TonB family protein [Pseudomonadota bacterium]
MQRAWGAQVRQDISRSQRNRRGRRSGEAVVALVVSRDGALRSHRLQRSSGDGRLDDAALSAVSAAAPFPPAPAGLDKPFYAFTLSIRFE